MSELLGELRDRLTQAPDRDRYALAVAAFYADEIDGEGFVSLTTGSVDGEVPLCVKPDEPEQGYVQPDYVTHPGSSRSMIRRGSDGISNDHHTYACELVGNGFDPVGRGYWADPNDEPR